MTQPVFDSDTNRPTYDVLGDRYIVLLSSEETGGAYSLFDFKVPKGNGPPPHVHSIEDESFYLLSGEVEFTIGGEVRRARAGDVVFGPKGIPHSFKGASDSAARMICLASPGGFERFFEEVGKRVTDRAKPPVAPTDDEVQNLIAVSSRYGLKIL